MWITERCIWSWSQVQQAKSCKAVRAIGLRQKILREKFRNFKIGDISLRLTPMRLSGLVGHF